MSYRSEAFELTLRSTTNVLVNFDNATDIGDVFIGPPITVNVFVLVNDVIESLEGAYSETIVHLSEPLLAILDPVDTVIRYWTDHLGNNILDHEGNPIPLA